MNIPPILRRIQHAWIAANELWLNISTADRIQYEEPPGWWRGQPTEKSQYHDNRAYGTPDYFYIRTIIKRLRPESDDIIYDLGSGKGRVLCVMSRRQVRKCIGIELFEELCQVARANAAKMRGRRSPIEIRCNDAVRAELSDGTIFFLFNPFGADTLAEVLAKLKQSLATNPRRVRLVYYNSVHRTQVEACGWLRHYDSFRTFNGLNVDFYRTGSY